MTSGCFSCIDFRAVDELLNIYFANQTVCGIVLSNRDHPAVCAFFDSLTELLDRQAGALFAHLSSLSGESPLFDERTIHWLSHIQTDMFLHLISHGYDEQQAKEQLKIMVHFLRGGVFSLLAEKKQNNV